MRKIIYGLAIVTLVTSCSQNVTGIQAEAQSFLDSFNVSYEKVNTAYNEAQWQSQIKITEGDSTNAVNERKAGEAYAAFLGDSVLISRVNHFLQQEKDLTALQATALKKILYNAANYGGDKADVSARITADNKQSAALYGFHYMLNGKEVTTNQIDGILRTETDVNKRLAAWTTSKEVGKELKDGLANLRDLRNKVVQGFKYNDYFSYQVSDYGMTADEMVALCRKINDELRPLFRELHTYARYELAKRYGVKEVPDYLPAHWLPNRWGQDWSAMIEVKGINLDSVLQTKSAEWIVKEGEEFYKSLGNDPLPQSFWDKSSLYPLPADATYKKNNHASAWHIDLEKDVRSLMSVEPNSEWFETVHHELGHIYYYMAYTNPDVPPILREGANRAFHEAFGSMIGMAAMQKAFLENKGLLPANTKSDDTQKLLQEALNFVTFIPFATGTMTEFEHDLYKNNLPKDQFNKRWWEIVKQYQGIVPPADRGEEYCDAATKTHINDDAAQYYDYALSFVILFQVHDHIAKNILKEDPHNTNYFGNNEVGAFLKNIMKTGATKDWRKVLKEATGSDLSAKAMLDYFEPLMKYLQEVNKGRKYTM
jgi:peptidyl-dipeptidase A